MLNRIRTTESSFIKTKLAIKEDDLLAKTKETVNDNIRISNHRFRRRKVKISMHCVDLHYMNVQCCYALWSTRTSLQHKSIFYFDFLVCLKLIIQVHTEFRIELDTLNCDSY